MFINYPSKKNTVPLRIIVPNLFTTIAMCCGLASISYTLKQDWDRAMLAVLLSAVFDAMDGRAARLLKVTSPFGEVLDSLSDFLSFGVAPAMLLHQWMLKEQEIWGLLAVTAFVLCSAMRLARFTAAARPAPPLPPGEEYRQTLLKSKFFTGMATPAAAGAVMVPVMLSYSKVLGPRVRGWFEMEMGTGPSGRLIDAPATGAGPIAATVVICYTILISLWMVSRVPMFSFKKMRVGRHAVVPLLVCVGLMVALAVRDFWLLIAAVGVLYLATVALSWPSRRRIMRRPVAELAEIKTRAVKSEQAMR